MKITTRKRGEIVKLKTLLLTLVLTLLLVPVTVSAQDKYTVKSGDSMWKIAVRYQIGVQEIINANPQVNNPNLIYPNQVLNIPNIDELKAIEREVIRLVNIERQKNGLPALKEHWELSRVARHKSNDMSNKGYFSHTSPTYGSPFDMIRSYGIQYRSAAENIAQGQRSAQQVVNSWLNSSGHRQNIMNRNFTHIGVGLDKNGYYWTQMFIAQ